MSGYYNQPPYGNYNAPPPFPPHQSPPQNMNYNAYNQQGYAQPPPQYSPPAPQQMYGGMEPTTPVLDENQMSFFWSHVNGGSIPGTFPPAQMPAQAFAPPQPPPPPQQQSYAPPPQQQYQYGQYSSQPPPTQGVSLQEPFQLQARQDVQMQDVDQDEDSWPEDDEDDYAPPDISAPAHVNGTSQAQQSYGGSSSVGQGKKPIHAAHTQPAQPSPKFNPFKSQSLHEVPPPVAQKVPELPKQQPRLNLELRHKVGDALKDFYAHGIGYSMLAQEPALDNFDKNELKQLYALYKVPLEPEVPVKAMPQVSEQSRRVAALRQFFAANGMSSDDNMLLTLVDSPIAVQALEKYPQPLVAPTAVAPPPVVPQPPPQVIQDARAVPPNRSLSTSTPRAEAGTPAQDRSAYLAKLSALKGKGSTSSQATPSTAAPTPTQKLPGLGAGAGATTPAKKVQLNREALQRKMQLAREAAAAKRLADADVSGLRPEMPGRTDSMSSIQYESGQASAQSGSDAANTPVQDISSPEEGEMEEGEVGFESGEIVEEPDVVEPSHPLPPKPAASIPGLPSKPPEATRPAHTRNDSNPSATNSPRGAGLPPRPKPTQVLPPAVYDHSRYTRNDHLKRPASSAFGQPWNPQAKRSYTTVDAHNLSDAPEPVVIDISSEDEGELTDDEDDVEMRETPDQAIIAKATASAPFSAGSAVATPQAPATPDPVAAARRENLATKMDLLKRQIQLKEAAKNSVLASASTSSPTARQTSEQPSVKRQAVETLEKDIKTDEDAIEEMERQMRLLREGVQRKKAALQKEIRDLGGEVEEGMSQAQMVRVRDGLVEAREEREAAMRDEEEEGEIEEEEDSGSGSEEGEVEEDEEVSTRPALPHHGSFLEALQGTVRLVSQEPDFEVRTMDQEPPTYRNEDIGEANDPRALESGARLLLHQLPRSFDKVFIRTQLAHYDITGISIFSSGGKKKKKNKNPQWCTGQIDFLYPAEAEEAFVEIKDNGIGGHKVGVAPAGNMKVPAAAMSRKAVGKAAIKERQAIPWNKRCCRIRLSGLPGHLHGKRNFGWMGSFSKEGTIKNFQWPKHGEMEFDIQDEYTAKNAVEQLPRRMKNLTAIIVDTPAMREAKANGGVGLSSMAAGKREVQNPGKAPAALEQDLEKQQVTQQELERVMQEMTAQEAQESSGSESDDEEEDDEEGSDSEDDEEDKMSVSEDASEAGQIIEDDYTQRVLNRAPSVEAQDDDDASDSMSESESESGSGSGSESDVDDQDGEVTGNVGVSLQDIEDIPMDDDGVSDGSGSDSSSDSEEDEANSNAREPSDDEDGEVEEPVQQIMPQDATEEEDASGSEEDAEGEMEEPVMQVPESSFAADAMPAGDAGEQDIAVDETIVESAPQPEQPPASPSMTLQTEPAIALPEQPSMVESAAPIQPQPVPAQPTADDVEMLDDDENDEDFYEPAAAPPAPTEEKTTSEADASGEDDDYDPEFDAAFEEAFAEAEEQLSAVPVVGEEQEGGEGGIPGVSLQEVSEDGEILSDDDDDFESLDKFPINEIEPDEPIEYDVPQWRPLGIDASTHLKSAAPAAPTTAFKPYVSALKGLKSYRFSPSFHDEVEGGIKSLTYSNKLDAQQPLCPDELKGGFCADMQHCPGQHLRGASMGDAEIIHLLATLDGDRSKEERKRWSEGLRIVIARIQEDQVGDIDEIARRVVVFRREFFGGSFLGRI